MPLSISVELGRTSLTIRELLALGQGSILQLDRHAGEPVDVLVNGKRLARGEVVVIDEDFGIRVTEVVAAGGAHQRDGALAACAASLPLALALLLALPASAFALTDKQFKDLANTKPSGDGTPQVGLDVGGGLVRGVIGFVVVIGVILRRSRSCSRRTSSASSGYMPRGRGRDGGLVEVHLDDAARPEPPAAPRARSATR